MSTALILLLITGVLFSAYLVVDSRGGVESITTRIPPAQVIAIAVQTIPTQTASLRSSWLPTAHTGDSANFVYKRRPSMLLAIILLLMFVLPAILYLILGGKTQQLSVSVVQNPDGSYTAQVASDGGVARRKGAAFLRGLATGEQQANPAQ